MTKINKHITHIAASSAFLQESSNIEMINKMVEMASQLGDDLVVGSDYRKTPIVDHVRRFSRHRVMVVDDMDDKLNNIKKLADMHFNMMGNIQHFNLGPIRLPRKLKKKLKNSR